MYDVVKEEQSLINKEGKQLLFVYGTLKRGCGANGMLTHKTENRFIGTCSTKGILLHLGGYPGLVQDDSVCLVTGEVFEVDWPTLMKCDQYEGVHRGLYTRQQIKTPFGRAWIYAMNDAVVGPKTMCVDKGYWIPSNFYNHAANATNRVTYESLLDFFVNRLGKEEATAVVEDKKVETLALPPPKAPEKEPVVLRVGPGTEMF